jgi:guanylate kinase
MTGAAMSAEHRGELFILSAPSGAGKTTLVRTVLNGPLTRGGSLVFSVSHTTRRPRSGEVDGHDYHFVPAATFQRMIAEDRFLEWAEVHGNYYGTSIAAVLPHLERGADVLADLDVQGAERLKLRFPEAHAIFVMPPSYEDLEARLRGRAADDPADIARRLAVSLWEIKRFDRYDYVIINAEAERASEALTSIILEKRHRRARMEPEVLRILADFARARAEHSDP